MPNIDIKVDADLSQLFQLPACADLSLPNAGGLSVQLPTGGALQAFADISKGIPTDCSLTFSLMLQIAPFLASIQCLLKVLKLLKPLIDIIKGLPVPPVGALIEFGEAARGTGALPVDSHAGSDYSVHPGFALPDPKSPELFSQPDEVPASNPGAPDSSTAGGAADGQ